MSYLFCCHKFHKVVNYFIFEKLKKKIWANFQRIIELFTQKIVTKLSKIWVWDPGSRLQGSKRHRIRIRNTAFYADFDPNFHLDADPDPDPDWHQRDDTDPHADRTPIFTHVGKKT
jgi:hypothetical protein